MRKHARAASRLGRWEKRCRTCATGCRVAWLSLTPRGGGSDHATFNGAGIPGFFWREDGSGGREGKNYTYVHHTQFDTTRFAAVTASPTVA